MPWRLPGTVGWNRTSTVHLPAGRVGQVVPEATETKSRLGAPGVKTETLPRVVPEVTVSVKACVAPGAANISPLGDEVTCADSRGATDSRQTKKLNRIKRRTANTERLYGHWILLSIWKTPLLQLRGLCACQC